MMLNIFGPSGSGKTTLTKSLLKYGDTYKFFGEFTNQNFNGLKCKINWFMIYDDH